MTFHSDSRRKKISNILIIVVIVLLTISVSMNIYSWLKKKNRETFIVSCDNQY